MSVFDDEVLTIDELASYLKLKRQTIYRWAQKGKLPGAKIGKEWRFRKSLIAAWLEKNLGASPVKGGPSTNGDSAAAQPEAHGQPLQQAERRARKRPTAKQKKPGPEKN